MERCVDDTVHYDTDIKTTLVEDHRLGYSRWPAAIVLNLEKFQFAERRVDFTGFRVSDNTIEPLNSSPSKTFSSLLVPQISGVVLASSTMSIIRQCCAT